MKQLDEYTLDEITDMKLSLSQSQAREKRMREALTEAQHWIVCSGAEHPAGIVQIIVTALDTGEATHD